MVLFWQKRNNMFIYKMHTHIPNHSYLYNNLYIASFYTQLYVILVYRAVLYITRWEEKKKGTKPKCQLKEGYQNGIPCIPESLLCQNTQPKDLGWAGAALHCLTIEAKYRVEQIRPLSFSLPPGSPILSPVPPPGFRRILPRA